MSSSSLSADLSDDDSFNDLMMKEEKKNGEEKFEVLATGEKVKSFQKKLRKKATLGAVSKKKNAKEEPEKIPKDVQFVKISKAIFANDGLELRESFLMCHKMFKTPTDVTLLTLWLEVYQGLLDQLKEFNSSRTQERIGQMINFMYTWATNHPDDFVDVHQKKALCKGLSAAQTPQNEALITKIVSVMLPVSPAVTIDDKQDPGTVTFQHIHSRALAVAMTLIEFEDFNKMQGREFVDMAWHRKDKEKLAPNVVHLSEHFNKVSYWTAFMILRHQNSPMNTQVYVVKKFIYVSYYLLKVCRNFNGLMEILLGLGLAQVKRKPVWQNVSQKVKLLYETLNKTMLPWNNFAQYKKKFKKLAYPKIPYFPLFCKDFTFIHEAIPKYSRGLLNLQLPLALNSHFMTLKSYVKGDYHLSVDASVIAFVENLPVLTEDVLEKMDDPECDDFDHIVSTIEVVSDEFSISTSNLSLDNSNSGSIS